MPSTTTHAQLAEWCKQANDLAQSRPVDEEAAKALVEQADKMNATAQLLDKTKAASVLAALRRASRDKQVKDAARSVLQRWKSDTFPAAAAKKKASTPTKTAAGSSKQSTTSAATPAASNGASSSHSGGPVVLKEPPAGFKPSISYVHAEVEEERASLPKRNKHGELVFEDHPEFRPNLTPEQVLQAGSFGGSYFRKITSGVTGKTYGDAWKEFPESWFAGLNIKRHVARQTYDVGVNKYGVKCGGDLNMWESSGWMSDIDPYGWFQWYCRFYLGRRSTDDERQIGRGLRCFSKTGRWRVQLCNKIMRQNARYTDKSISPVIRQTLLHWGYELTERDYNDHVKRNSLKK